MFKFQSDLANITGFYLVDVMFLIYCGAQRLLSDIFIYLQQRDASPVTQHTPTQSYIKINYTITNPHRQLPNNRPQIDSYRVTLKYFSR